MLLKRKGNRRFLNSVPVHRINTTVTIVMAPGRLWKGIVCDTCVREREKRLILNFFKKPVRTHTDTTMMFFTYASAVHRHGTSRFTFVVEKNSRCWQYAFGRLF